MFNPLAAVAPLARAAAIASGWLLMAISCATVVEIVGRRWFGFSFRGVDEISGYVLAVTSAAGFCWAFVTRSHMRITLLFPYVPPIARTVPVARLKSPVGFTVNRRLELAVWFCENCGIKRPRFG